LKERKRMAKRLDYTGYNDVAVYDDGSWISPASSARSDDDFQVAVWDGEGYKVRRQTDDPDEFAFGYPDGFDEEGYAEGE
jgi:hypothetical protein